MKTLNLCTVLVLTSVVLGSSIALHAAQAPAKRKGDSGVSNAKRARTPGARSIGSAASESNGCDEASAAPVTLLDESLLIEVANFDQALRHAESLPLDLERAALITALSSDFNRIREILTAYQSNDFQIRLVRLRGDEAPCVEETYDDDVDALISTCVRNGLLDVNDFRTILWPVRRATDTMAEEQKD